MIANVPTAAVSVAAARTVCKIGQGSDCCRYLVCGANGFECMKHSEWTAFLDRRADAGGMTATADNCPGIKPGFPQEDKP